jgi:hypothetical protein
MSDQTLTVFDEPADAMCRATLRRRSSREPLPESALNPGRALSCQANTRAWALNFSRSQIRFADAFTFWAQ